MFKERKMNNQGIIGEGDISGQKTVDKKINLVIFDEECDDLGDFTSNYESQVYKEEESVVSDETEKRKK